VEKIKFRELRTVDSLR